jgi:(p)ppGpp synthase/HD superfamily hydrolase
MAPQHVEFEDEELHMTQDSELVRRAAEFARAKHGDTLDDNGQVFFDAHPAKVADLLKVVAPDDENLIAAGYLHDTVEDTDATYAELVQEFNQDIADLVMEVTQEGRKDSFGYYFPRLQSQRAITLKFADRLSNLTRLQSWNQKRRAQYLRKSRFWKTSPHD